MLEQSVHLNLKCLLILSCPWPITCLMQDKICCLEVSEFLVTWTKWPITGVQEINRYVFDIWLHCSLLRKHINGNVLCFPEHKHKYALDSLPNLLRELLTVWENGRVAWEKCQLHESRAECVENWQPSQINRYIALLILYHHFKQGC